MTPTGNSEAPVATRATESQSMRNMAPTIADVGKRIRWSGPITSRVMWGIMRPTNPMIPLMETTAPVIKEPMSRSICRTLFRVNS